MKRIKSKGELSNSVQVEAEDRISELPEAIFQQILSFLHLKHAVQTSVLAKRWKISWSCLPDLNFSFRNLADLSRVSTWNSQDVDRFMPQFICFVIQYLSHRDGSSQVGEFRLCSDLTSTDSRFVEQCLEYAISHGAQGLDLDVFCCPTPVNFSVDFFACKSLRTLKLKQYTNSLVIPRPFILPNVTTLRLECFKFRDDDELYSFSIEPFSGLPNLEKLTLHRCEVDDLIICSSKLKILEISFRDMFFSREKKMGRISAPMLTSFRYEGYVSLVCPVIDLPCLEEVYFHHFAVLEAPYTDDIGKKMPKNLTRMLGQLGNAKFITLTTETIEVLAMDPELLEQTASPFPHMKHLKLMKERYGPNSIVPEKVMNYLTMGIRHGRSLVVQSLIGYNL